ncbi:hypothetical protein PIROE2DRAFT_13537 [Piromyces sp. E2]|nr:hypothetical protein PIROE2DRAFT_13537 [Piromyces sp. E2]|eukprot:OUM60632.1 hypothetical protein PIROE2DRAFT_13537 [Piromyces sp. E2]
MFGLNSIIEGKAVFAKFYTLTYSLLNNIPYTMTILPGYKEGVSGGIIAGYNIGIDGIIPEEKLDASITAFEFLTSKEIQKKYFLVENIISGITSLYDDEEICEKVSCDTMKKIQPVNRPTSEYYHFSEYYQKIENYVYQYLYENETVEYVLEKIEDLTRIHYVSFTEKDSNYEIAINSWIISVFGLIVLISDCYTTLGPVTTEKCHFYIVLLILGYSLNITPILYQLIVNSPEQNKVTKWIVNIFDVKLVMVNEGKNFKMCKVNTFGFYIKNVSTLIPVITSYITTYGFRIYLPLHKANEMDILKMLKMDSSSSKSTSKIHSDTNNKKYPFILKLRDYHDRSTESSVTNTFASNLSNEISRQRNN